tara:strand:+ start:2057 stop:3232 length:1176 start_codon:yes stop_codon:yes gene_type:complete
MNKENVEKIDYSNIEPIFVGGKKKFRFAYHGKDNKPKYLTNISKIKLKDQVVKHIEENGFIKTSTTSCFLYDAYNLWYKRQLYKEKNYGKPSKSCIKDYDSFYRCHILPHFQGQDLRLIDKKSIVDFVNALEDKVDEGQINSKTLSKIYNVFKVVLDYSVNKNKLHKNPCNSQDFLADIEIVEKEFEPIDFEYWTINRIVKLIESVYNPKVKLLFFIMLETACRPSEARGLIINNLHLTSNRGAYISIKSAVKRDGSLGLPKTKGGTRDLVISSSLKDRLNEYVSKLPKDQNSLFKGSTNEYITLKVLLTNLDKALAKMGEKLPVNRKCYFFRHYTATLWAKEKKYVDPMDLATALGDKDINFVNRTYIKPYATKTLELEKSDWQNNQFNY